MLFVGIFLGLVLLWSTTLSQDLFAGFWILGVFPLFALFSGDPLAIGFGLIFLPISCFVFYLCISKSKRKIFPNRTEAIHKEEIIYDEKALSEAMYRYLEAKALENKETASNNKDSQP